MVKRNEKGKILKRVPGEYSNKLITFRVTESEFRLIKDAKKRGFEPRAVVLTEARKVMNEKKTVK